MAQDRKVFVGGVPQDLNQDDLYTIFSEYAGVKKAWLQKCRAADDTNGANNPPQNHRGFGFVIFHDPNAIEELLGGGLSRFIILRSGAKLEVKRALSSSKMSGASSRSEAVQDTAPLVWPAGGGHGQPQAQQPLPAAPELASRERQLVAPAQPLAHPVSNWPNQVNDGSVLGQLSLMPTSMHGYPNEDLRRKATGVTNLVADMGVSGLTASDGAPLSYGMVSHAVAPQPRHSHHGLLRTPVSNGASLPSASDERSGIGTRKPFRDAIVQFYQKHRPDKLTQHDFIDSICSYYEDKADALDESLRRKYGEGLDFSLGAQNHHMQQGESYAQLGTAPEQQNIDQAYMKRMNAEASNWLYPGLQTAQLPRQPPPQASQGLVTAAPWVDSMMGHRDHLAAGNVAITNMSPNMGMSNAFLSSGADPAGYVTNTGAAFAGNIGRGANGFSASGNTGTAMGGVHSMRHGKQAAGDGIVNLGEVHSGGPSQVKAGGDEGFEISVEVAEAIVGH